MKIVILTITCVNDFRPTLHISLAWWSLNCRNGNVLWKLSTNASEFMEVFL